MKLQRSGSLAGHIAHELAGRIIRGELKDGQRIREVKVAELLGVGRGSVREALLILQRRHLVEILPNRGARVMSLTAEKVVALYDLLIMLYTMLANEVADHYEHEAELIPFSHVFKRLHDCRKRGDLKGFAEASFGALSNAYRFSHNPFLQASLENLQPVVSRTYHMALEQRRGHMADLLDTLEQLLEAVKMRDKPAISHIVKAYCEQNSTLILTALAHGHS